MEVGKIEFCVEVGDSKFYFEDAGFDMLYELSQIKESKSEEGTEEEGGKLINKILKHLVRVEGVTFAGAPVDANGLRELKLPLSVISEITQRYSERLIEIAGGGLNALDPKKKESPTA